MSVIRVGSAPDSWGVWFPEDPQQTPYGRFLDEVSASGYEWIELGPYGYLPTDPQQLRDELAAHNLKLSAGTVFEHLHQDAQYHPHADSHVDTEENVYRFLDGTDSEYVNLCLDTGHISYCGGDNLAIIERAPERIGYLHLKQVDPEVRAKVEAEDLPFGEAVKLGAMIEPPLGIPDLPPLLAAIEKLDIDVFAIVEQDLYPCAVDVPLPIAQRTRKYLGSCGIPSVKFV
ncbi:MAG: 2-keto-myo-inositol dehydratase [Rhodococcus sp. (in: high G+C Gram-positive bacteria)]|nr:MAG: 2-keto-myo-inositol dehydratase [Rhodococcus sp. (in: high G+C Gram-positive bacteria)]